MADGRRRVLDFLEEHKRPATIHELRLATGLTLEQVRWRLKALVAEGLVTSIGVIRGKLTSRMAEHYALATLKEADGERRELYLLIWDQIRLNPGSSASEVATRLDFNLGSVRREIYWLYENKYLTRHKKGRRVTYKTTTRQPELRGQVKAAQPTLPTPNVTGRYAQLLSRG